MANSWLLVAPGIFAVLASVAGVWFIRRYAGQHHPFGVPGLSNSPDNPLHPTHNSQPRGGGLAILVIVLLLFMPIGFSLGDPGQVVRFALAGAMIGAIGFFDDFRAFPRSIRLFAQALAALIFVPAAPIRVIDLPRLEIVLPDAAGYLLGVVWIVGLSNVYSYMDGINGLASGQAALAGALWAAVGFIAQQPVVMLLGLLIAGTALGFTVYNLPPNSIFLGDVGSNFLGFSLAALPMLAASPINASSSGEAGRLMVTGGLFVGLFVFDAMLTFFRYLLQGRDVSGERRSHLYQRLVQLGEPPGRVTMLYLGLSLGFGIAGLIYWQEATLAALVVCAAVCLALLLWITRREAKHKPLNNTPH